MGQAKLRKQEIAQLKANSAKQTAELINFGTFYRDDKDDGVSINLNSLVLDGAIPGFVKIVYDNITTCGHLMIEEVRNGNDTVEAIFTQLKQAIKQYNIICFGSEVRPQQCNHQVDLHNNELVTIMMVIMSDIYVLTELGYIKNDNYNGLHIMHMTTNDNVTTVTL